MKIQLCSTLKTRYNRNFVFLFRIDGWRDVAYRDISGANPSEQFVSPGDETQALTQNQAGNATEAYI